VPPAELEAVLLTHPAIKDAAVIAVPDHKAGELPLAFVVKQPGARVTKDDIIKHVAGKSLTSWVVSKYLFTYRYKKSLEIIMDCAHT
jgi:acyl-CoA synthetase (AMP-forming)/AMP-acid ligase II